MKALEILKWLAASGVFQKEANEAIAELEALQANYEAQEIIIADLHKELEAANESYLLLLKSYHEITSPKTCDGCSHEKQSSPLYIHCFGCNRMKTLIDKYHDKNTPCKE